MKNTAAKPFVKWAGGKGRVLPMLEARLPKDFPATEYTYIEPFVGGGALLFHLLNNYSNITRAIICDKNSDLINTYRVVKETPLELIGLLKRLETEYLPRTTEARKEFYAFQRDTYNRREVGPVEAAALFIFLNRTCFNGLYRVNNQGRFNVPIGKYKAPRICDRETILADSQILQQVEILEGDYRCVQNRIEGRTFIYFDPPYRPVSPTANFNTYTAERFDDDDQVQLRDFIVSVADKCRFLLSNSDCADGFFDRLYGDFRIERIRVPRTINSIGARRGEISEIIVSPSL